MKPRKISRRTFLRSSAALLPGAALGPGILARSSRKDRPRRPPNLVYVFPDQFRAMGLGCMGEDPVFTPNLDGFAAQSLNLTHACSTRPLCSPYRAMLMTGKYYVSNGVWSNCTSRYPGMELGRDEICLTDTLKKAGYEIAYIGKWHLESPHPPYVPSGNNRGKVKWEEWTPPERRHSVDFWYAYNTWDDHFRPHYWTNDSTRDKRVEIREWSPIHETNVAMRFLENEGGRYRDPRRPFALFLAFNPPHMPYGLVPGKYKKVYRDFPIQYLANRKNVDLESSSRGARLVQRSLKNYFAMITGVDEQFGRLLAALERLGLAEDTVVVFTSDHGNCLGCHDKVSKNNPFDESLRVPFLVRWPGRIRPRRDDLLLATPDIYPTLVDLLGRADLVPSAVEGTSHAGLFLGGSGPRPESTLYCGPYTGDPTLGERGIRTHRYTLVVRKFPDKPPAKILFDNLADPFQMENLAEKMPDLVEELARKHLHPWLEKIRDPWLPGRG